MITFRRKNTEQDLMPKAIQHLKECGLPVNIIKASDADRASKVNSKARVITSFRKNEAGYYEFTVKAKEFYRYMIKELGDIIGMRVTDTNQSERTVTAETDHLGVILDVIEFFGIRYNLSLVSE